MPIEPSLLFGLLSAIGGGLLVGIERERRKGSGAQRSAIGMRTCTVAALSGAAAALVGTAALAVAGFAIVALALAAYWRVRQPDPGLTTELALFATFLLGALAMSRAELAAALYVALAGLLAGKSALHRFARSLLSEKELTDALILAACILVVLPLLPDRAIDPLGVLNPRRLWLFAVLVMAINAAGHVALRALGPGRGLALSGFLGGFVSSSATIAGMAQRARRYPALRRECIAAALLSNIATVLELALVLGAVSLELLRRLAPALLVAGLAAAGIGVLALRRARGGHGHRHTVVPERAFALVQALQFVAILAAALLLGAALRYAFGARGIFAAAAATGFADVHAAAITVGQLVSVGAANANLAAFAVAVAFVTNSVTKCVLSLGGGRAYAAPTAGGVLVIDLMLLLAVWLI